jgi:hypothetical protein
MDATTNGVVFTDEDFNKEYGAECTKHDAPSGRIITHTFVPQAGHILQISGKGVPGELVVSVDSEYVNMLARVLLDATYDEHLII